MTDSPYAAPASSTASPQPKSWWQRNWKWLVPTGCGCFTIVIVAAFIGLAWMVLGLLKDSGAYHEALEEAKANSAVREILGTPIQEGWYVTGNVSFSGTTGEADLAIPISGPKGKGTVYAVAEKDAEKWTFSTLQFKAKGSGEIIDLLGDSGQGS